MSLLLAAVISLLVAAGVLLVLSRDLFRVVIGLAVLGGAVNLIVFFAGRPGSLVSPVIESGAQGLAADAANPLTQALVLTAIVIGFSLLAFSLVLGARLSRQSGQDDTDQLRHAEPADCEPVKPSVLEP